MIPIYLFFTTLTMEFEGLQKVFEYVKDKDYDTQYHIDIALHKLRIYFNECGITEKLLKEKYNLKYNNISPDFIKFAF